MTFGFVAIRGAEHLLDFLDEAAAAGGRVIAQTHCRGISVLLSFKTRVPFDLLPEWQEFRALPEAEQLSRPARSRNSAIGSSTRLRDADYSSFRGVGAQARPPDFEGIRVYRHGLPPNPSVADIARERGVHPVEAMIDLGVETSFEQLFIQPSLYPQDEAVLLRALAPSARGDDVLGFGRTPQSDRRLVDPHPSARSLGARSRGVHARGSGQDDHARARAGVGIRRPRLGARRHGRRPERLRPRARRTGGPDAGRRSPGRRPAPAAEISRGSRRRS